MVLPNNIVDHGEWYTSYNAVDHAIYVCDTTAIVIGQMQAFFVLKGDHRQQLNGLSLSESIAYFVAHTESFHHIS